MRIQNPTTDETCHDLAHTAHLRCLALAFFTPHWNTDQADMMYAGIRNLADRIIAMRTAEQSAAQVTSPTFEQFQSSRTECADLRDMAGLDPDADVPVRGFTYMGGLWVVHQLDGQFWMILEQDEHLGYDLTVLERALYQYGIDSCNFEG